MNRRAVLAAAAAAASVAAGCGFELRRAAALPLRSIALVGFAPDSSLRRVLEGELQRAGVALHTTRRALKRCSRH